MLPPLKAPVVRQIKQALVLRRRSSPPGFRLDSANVLSTCACAEVVGCPMTFVWRYPAHGLLCASLSTAPWVLQ